jgi:hypothetical protein
MTKKVKAELVWNDANDEYLGRVIDTDEMTKEQMWNAVFEFLEDNKRHDDDSFEFIKSEDGKSVELVKVSEIHDYTSIRGENILLNDDGSYQTIDMEVDE